MDYELRITVLTVEFMYALKLLDLADHKDYQETILSYMANSPLYRDTV